MVSFFGLNYAIVIPQKNLFVELHIGLYSWNLLLAEDAKLKAV
jgi:hypothetical protein